MKLQNQSHSKHFHQLRYPCPTCSICTAINARVLIPPPNCQFPPKPVVRVEPFHLACHHGEVPLPVAQQWVSQILESFNFEAGYTFINQFNQVLHFPPYPAT